MPSNGELTFQVKGMDCAGCAQTVEKGVSQLPGVTACSLNFGTEKLRVTGQVSRAEVTARVQELGYEAVELTARSTISPLQGGIEGGQGNEAGLNFLSFMWQRPETRLALLGLLLILPGLFLEELLGIHHPLVYLASLGALVTAGWPVARSAWRSLRINREVNINVLMTIAGIGALLIGEYTEAGLVLVLFALGEALEGYTGNRARAAIRSLLAVVPNEATLLRSAGPSPRDGRRCVFAGIEGGSSVRRRGEGRLLSVSKETRTPVDELQVGDVILVKPGERIPMDGRVVAGASAVNQAPITGESGLVEKEAGSPVFASSVNGEGSLEIEVTHLAADNTISRMIQMVEEAQEKRAPAQRFVDRFAKYYTPAVVVVAVLVALIPPLFFGQPFLNPSPSALFPPVAALAGGPKALPPLGGVEGQTFGWLYRGLALLVVACPCALVISAPVTLISAISNAARRGALIKGGAYLEALSQVKAIAFDKTGTLTEGKPVVTAIRAMDCQINQLEGGLRPPTVEGGPPSPPIQNPKPALSQVEGSKIQNGSNCSGCNDLLALASALERRSEHPMAYAIMKEAQKQGVQDRYPAAEMVTALAGRGLTGRVEGRQITIGSHPYFDSHIPHAEEICVQAQQAAAQGYTPMLVSAEGQYLGIVTVADTVRESSREALSQLKQLGLAPVVMLTGDNPATAHRIAEQVGVTEAFAGLLPEEKVAAVEALQAQYGAMAMVGDGINDAPALATARVGIALGGAFGGTAQAMETADITLMSHDLRQLPFLFKLSRATMNTLRANIIFSLGIKLIFLALVLAGLGTMWMAVLADVGTSLLVTLNGMRLLRWPGR